MLQWIMHGWERRLVAVTKDRGAGVAPRRPMAAPPRADRPSADRGQESAPADRGPEARAGAEPRAVAPVSLLARRRPSSPVSTFRRSCRGIRLGGGGAGRSAPEGVFIPHFAPPL